jgi:hypothetical protein
MSDFFTRLVDRARGRGPAVRPLVAPLFAPDREVAGKSTGGKQLQMNGRGAAQISGGSAPPEMLVEKSPVNLAHGSDSVKSPADLDGSITAGTLSQTIPMAHEQSQQAIPVGHKQNEQAHNQSEQAARVARNQHEDAREPESFAARTIQRKDGTPAALEPRNPERLTRGELAQVQNNVVAVSDDPGVTSTDAPESPESGLVPLPGGKRQVFTAVRHFVHAQEPRRSDQLLIKEQVLTSQTEAYPGSGGGTSSALSPGMLPRTVISQEGAASTLSGVRVPASEGALTAPTIRVTIGRIEVRALTEPSPPVKRAASQVPRVSLDEYLKQQPGDRK